MIDFSLFRKTADTAASELKKITQTIEKKKREREELMTLPIPREEYLERLQFHVNREADRFLKCLGGIPGRPRPPLSGPFVDMDTMVNVPVLSLTGGGAKNEPTLLALFGVLRAPILAGLESVVDNMDYPAEVGPRSDERKPMIDKLDKEIADAEEKWEALQVEINKSLGSVVHPVGQNPKLKQNSPGTKLIGSDFT